MHPISRSSKLKSNVNAGLIEKLSPFAAKPTIKVSRAHSLAESKKTSKLMMKSTKQPRARLEIDTFLRLSKTPTPPPSASSQMSEVKTQEITQLKAEVVNLKNSLEKANETIESLKKCKQCESFRVLESEKTVFQGIFVELVQKSLSSNEVSNVFKQQVRDLLEKVNDSSWVQGIGELNKKVEEKNLIGLDEPAHSQVDTARFRSCTDSQAFDSVISQGIVLEIFDGDGFKLRPGDRVDLVYKESDLLWNVRFNGTLGKVPSNFIFID
jgi:hypothetical protein